MEKNVKCRVETFIYPFIPRNNTKRRSEILSFKWLKEALLTHFKPTTHFDTPRKRQKSIRFLTFLGSIKMEHWLEIGSLLPSFVKHFIANFSISTKSWWESRIKHVNDKFWYFIAILNLHVEVVQWLLLYCIVSLAFAIQRSSGQNVLAKVYSKY